MKGCKGWGVCTCEERKRGRCCAWVRLVNLGSTSGLQRNTTKPVSGAQALPTLLLFREGCAVDRVEGFMAQALLAKRVRYYAGRMDKKFGRQ